MLPGALCARQFLLVKNGIDVTNVPSHVTVPATKTGPLCITNHQS